jgi:hypothetical protein
MPVLSEFPSFGVFIALYVFWVCLAQFYFSVGTVFFVWERRKRQHRQRVGAGVTSLGSCELSGNGIF